MLSARPVLELYAGNSAVGEEGGLAGIFLDAFIRAKSQLRPSNTYGLAEALFLEMGIYSRLGVELFGTGVVALFVELIAFFFEFEGHVSIKVTVLPRGSSLCE